MKVITRVSHATYLLVTILSLLGVVLSMSLFCYYNTVSKKNQLKSTANLYTTTINAMVRSGISDSHIRSILQQVRFCDDMSSYFFAVDTDTQLIFHPINSRLSGTQAGMARDSLGTPLYQTILKALVTDEPFFTYRWRGIERGSIENKLGYVTETDNGWILVASQYNKNNHMNKIIIGIVFLWLTLVVVGILWLRKLLLPITTKIDRLKINITKILQTATGTIETKAEDELDYICNMFGAFMATIMQTYGDAVSSAKRVRHNCETLKMVAIELKRLSLQPTKDEFLKYVNSFEDKINTVYATTTFINSQLDKALKTTNRYMDNSSVIFETQEGRQLKESLQAIQQSINNILANDTIPERTIVTICTTDTEINADSVEMSVLSQDQDTLHYLMKALSIEMKQNDNVVTSVDRETLITLYRETIEDTLDKTNNIYDAVDKVYTSFVYFGTILEHHRSTVPGSLLSNLKGISDELNRCRTELKALASIRTTLSFINT